MSLRNAFGRTNAHRGMGRTQRRLRTATVVGVVAATPLVGLAGATSANAASTSTWDKVAQCESGGNWSINTGNGYYGGLQFTQSTWSSHGGKGSPHKASKAEQIRIAEKVLKTQGPGAWPVCSKKAGLTRGGESPASSSKSGSSSSGKSTTSKSTTSKNSTSKSTTSKNTTSKNSTSKSTTSKNTTSSSKPSTSSKQTTTTQSTSASAEGVYVVKTGDTLSSIAAAHNVGGGWQKLFAKNQNVVGSNPDLIYPGQKLVLR